MLPGTRKHESRGLFYQQTQKSIKTNCYYNMATNVK